MKQVSVTLVSVVNCYFKPLSWYKWIKSFKINWNCNLLLIIFSISLLIVLSKTISQKVLEESYDSLLGLGIIIDVKTLKCNGQWPNSIHILVIPINFLKYAASSTILLKCFYNNLSGSGVDKLLHFVIALINSSSENKLYFVTFLLGISSSKSESIWWFCTILKDRWRACHKLLSSIYSQPLYWIASIAGSLCFLTQSISFYSPQFLLAIS